MRMLRRFCAFEMTFGKLPGNVATITEPTPRSVEQGGLIGVIRSHVFCDLAFALIENALPPTHLIHSSRIPNFLKIAFTLVIWVTPWRLQQSAGRDCLQDGVRHGQKAREVRQQLWTQRATAKNAGRENGYSMGDLHCGT